MGHQAQLNKFRKEQRQWFEKNHSPSLVNLTEEEATEWNEGATETGFQLYEIAPDSELWQARHTGCDCPEDKFNWEEYGI
jgi:hypothetical protein